MRPLPPDGSGHPAGIGGLLTNPSLMSALLSCLAAQLLKPLAHQYLHPEKRLDWKWAVSPGGMPSSHTAFVVGLTTALGMLEGTQSNLFALALVLSLVVAYDATGVRLHAGRHASVLNIMIAELPPEHPASETSALQETLGHTPVQLTDQQQDSMSGTLSSVQQHQLQQQLFPILGHCRSGTELVHMAGCTDHFLQHTLPQCCEYPAVQASALQVLFELQQAAASNRLLPGHYLDLCELLLRATTPHQLCDQLAGVRTRYAKLQDWYAAQAAAAAAAATAAAAEAEAAAAAEAEAAAGPIQFSDDLLAELSAELSAELGGAAAPDMAAAAAAVSPEACSKAAVSLALQ
ncbi:hypothetical protein OEZ86_000706 [Tetradesmus obliquus]|nr:hypothetical protein OEZ86_000706 [Tetradesmus obliquus]